MSRMSPFVFMRHQYESKSELRNLAKKRFLLTISHKSTSLLLQSNVHSLRLPGEFTMRITYFLSSLLLHRMSYRFENGKGSSQQTFVLCFLYLARPSKHHSKPVLISNRFSPILTQRSEMPIRTKSTSLTFF